MEKSNSKIVVGVSGASGAIYGVRLLEKLRLQPAVETHLILTRSGEKTLFLETGKKTAELKALAKYSYALDDISGRLASGSFDTDGMVIAPCSIHTMSAIAHGISSNLLIRAADVTLVALAEMGAIIAPPAPGFYQRPETILDLVDHSVDRVLDLLGLPSQTAQRWDGPAVRG